MSPEEFMKRFLHDANKSNNDNKQKEKPQRIRSLRPKRDKNINNEDILNLTITLEEYNKKPNDDSFMNLLTHI